MLSFCGRRALVEVPIAFLYEVDEFIDAVAEASALHDERVYFLSEYPAALVLGVGRAVARDVGAGAAFFVHEAGDFQFAKGAYDRIGVDEQLLGEGPNRRQFCVGFESAGGDHVLKLLCQL